MPHLAQMLSKQTNTESNIFLNMPSITELKKPEKPVKVKLIECYDVHHFVSFVAITTSNASLNIPRSQRKSSQVKEYFLLESNVELLQKKQAKCSHVQ
jgi:hypothetical protein